MLTLTLLTSTAAYAVPVTMTHQGTLVSEDGASALSGDQTLLFTIYDAAEDGAEVWSQQIQVSLGEGGFFTVVLGEDSNPLDSSVFDGGSYFLGLTVGEGQELSPRMPITSVPYAQLAGRAQAVVPGAITSEAFAPGAIGDDQIADLDWAKLANIPADIADGDSDILATLMCGPGQLAAFDGTSWICSDPSGSGQTFVAADQNCGMGRVAVGFDMQGLIACTALPDFSGADFATSNQNCMPGQFARGIDAAGNLSCATVPLFDGSDFATSNQGCQTGEVVTGIDANGALTCTPQNEFDGSDFATSGQACQVGQVVTGIANNGTVTCADNPKFYDDRGLASAIANRLTVSVRSDCGTSSVVPQMEVYVNQRQVGSTTPVPNASFADYTFSMPGNQAQLIHEVAIYFVNNGTTGGCNRNLYVEHVTLSNGKRIEATDQVRVFYDIGVANNLRQAFDERNVLAGRQTMTSSGALRFQFAPAVSNVLNQLNTYIRQCTAGACSVSCDPGDLIMACEAGSDPDDDADDMDLDIIRSGTTWRCAKGGNDPTYTLRAVCLNLL